MINTRLFCAMLIAACMSLVPVTVTATQSKSWNFSVLLDGDNIGYHRFELTDLDGERLVTSEAKFDVRFLFINAFRYRHSNTEVWSDGCLRRIDSETLANSKKLMVSGARKPAGFVVDDGRETSVFDECVMTFAYWDSDFLKQPRLLNSQSGEYLDVEVEKLGSESISVRGQQTPAVAYRLKAKKIEVTLWYSPDDEWLALESVAKGGRILRYELT